jgi:outer membrane lipoprotein-sorting protein
MTTITHFRDEGLGAMLRALDVPEHGATFFPDLEASLRTVERRRLRRERRFLAAAVVVAVAVAVLPQVVGVRGSAVARAAEVRARVAAALAEVRSARGEVTYTAVDARGGKRTTTRQSFALDATGDERLADSAGNVRAYDASSGVERAITTSASLGTGRFYAERVSLAPGPPDESAATSLLETQLAAVVRALAAAADPRVRNVDYDGRPAWQLDFALTSNTIYADVDHLSVTVDRVTGFPLRVLATLGGRFRSEMHLGQLKVDQPLSATVFNVDFPRGAEVLRTDAGFSNVDLRQAASIAGYRPLVPAHVPDGFRLAAVAAARSAERTGPGQSNPPSRRVVSLAYRRGLEQFVVTTRLRGEERWHDPFALEGVPLHREQVRLDGGALATAPVELAVDPRSLPHLWAFTDQLVVTIAGDLSREQLINVAETLR